MDQTLDRDTIRRALDRLNERLRVRGSRADLFVIGGAVMCLVHQARPATKDVDAWFTNVDEVRDGVREVAGELGLPATWLNDAAKGFVPPNATYDRWEAMSNLTIATADDRTLLAMKCAAARTEQDRDDIRFLVRRLGLRSSREVLAIVLDLYPVEQLPVRARLLLEEMLDDGQ